MHFALLQRNQRREHAEQRRLAAAVGAQEREDFARGHVERQVGDRLVLAVAMGEVRDVDGGRVGHAVRRFGARLIGDQRCMADSRIARSRQLVSFSVRLLARAALLFFRPLRLPTSSTAGWSAAYSQRSHEYRA